MTSSTNAKKRRSIFSRLPRGLRSPETVVGLSIAAAIFTLGIIAPAIVPYAPDAQSFDAFLPPSSAHWFGTDEFGRDLFSRVLIGIRQDVYVGLIAVPLGAILGTLLGLASALSRILDTIIQRAFDVSLAFTSLVMGLTVASIIGPGLEAIIVTVTLVTIPLFGRLARSAVRSQLGRDYVTAARVIGVKPARLLLRHVLPNAIDSLIVQAALSFALAVFIEGAMSFLGIGIRPPEPSLGSLLRTSMAFLNIAPVYALAPMAIVTLLVLSFNMAGDGLNKGLLRR